MTDSVSIISYDAVDISVVSQTSRPKLVVQKALNTCMHDTLYYEANGTLKQHVIDYLVSASHTSVLEHLTMTIEVHNISRALLDQILRQRTFKPTAGSQHYQDYSDYDFLVHPGYAGNSFGSSGAQHLKQETAFEIYKSAFEHAQDSYKRLIALDVPREEARMVLPMASRKNLMLTADARNMMLFFRQRLCERNVAEMISFAKAWLTIASQWFPQLFNSKYAQPECAYGPCRQGRMQAEVCRRKGWS